MRSVRSGEKVITANDSRDGGASASSNTAAPMIKIDGLVKKFGPFTAVDEISFSVARGEVLGFLGPNGAGKSTLVKMIYGLVKPDTGDMRLHGEVFSPTEPRADRAAGVGMAFQHFSLFDALSVAENIALGMEDAP